VKSSPRSPFMAENKLRMVVSWNPDIFNSDPQYSMLIEMANWIQAEIYERPTRSCLTPTHDDNDCCLLFWVGTLLVWGIFGHMDKELLQKEEEKRNSKLGQSVQEANMNSLTAKQLKKHLQDRGLSTTGRKHELVARLYGEEQIRQQAGLNLLHLSERYVSDIYVQITILTFGFFAYTANQMPLKKV
jgi:cell division protein FtsB